MKTSKPVLVVAGLTAFALVGFALYLQHFKDMLPCPLCVLQRYAYVTVGAMCLLFALLPRGVTKIGASLGALVSLVGAGIAGWHVWVKAHPAVSCGIDPMETALNKIVTAELLPSVFRAEGLCSAEYEPIFGLSIPEWSLIWFAAFVLILVWAALRQSR